MEVRRKMFEEKKGRKREWGMWREIIIAICLFYLFFYISSPLQCDLCIYIVLCSDSWCCVADERLIIRSITLECVAGPCYDWSAFLLSPACYSLSSCVFCLPVSCCFFCTWFISIQWLITKTKIRKKRITLITIQDKLSAFTIHFIVRDKKIHFFLV